MLLCVRRQRSGRDNRVVTTIMGLIVRVLYRAGDILAVTFFDAYDIPS